MLWVTGMRVRDAYVLKIWSVTVRNGFTSCTHVAYIRCGVFSLGLLQETREDVQLPITQVVIIRVGPKIPEITQDFAASLIVLKMQVQIVENSIFVAAQVCGFLKGLSSVSFTKEMWDSEITSNSLTALPGQVYEEVAGLPNFFSSTSRVGRMVMASLTPTRGQLV
jgi:hypothetical protein